MSESGQIPTSTATVNPPVDMRWGSGASVRDRLFAEGSRFNFYQAVRVLTLLDDTGKERAYPELPVHFRASMSFDFPAGDLAEMTLPDGDGLPTMIVHFLGLAGAHGPLPATYAESLLRPRTSALRDFLDIFHHRLILLLYRIHQMHHPVLTSGSPDESLMAQHLYAIVGLGRDDTSALRKGLSSVPDRALLNYTGLLAQRPHSANGLQRLLSDYFGVKVSVDEFLGGWLDLAEDQWTCIGEESGRNQALGDGALLGRRVWDEHVGVKISIGPMDLKTFEGFLPHRPAYRPLCQLTRFYLGSEINFWFQLLLRSDQIPEVVASSAEREDSTVRRAELGRIFWLESGGSGKQAVRASVAGSVMVAGDLEL